MKRIIFHFREELIRLDLIIPKSCFGKFVLEFGKIFRTEDPVEGVRFLRKIDDYCEANTDNVHINISFPIIEKKKFFDFLQEFCTKRHLGYPSFEQIFANEEEK